MVEDIVRSARTRVASGWCQGEDARDAAGAPVEFWGEDARAWSLLGALVAPSHPTPLREVVVPLAEVAAAVVVVADVMRTASLKDWNDAPGRTQEQVVAALDAALERLATTPAAGDRSAGAAGN
jgi:peptidoglycan/LPS O-acetylase OafA/YrhL